MYLRFDKSKMELNVVCGILENYKPSKNIKEIHKLVDELKAKMTKFQEEVLDPELKKIDALVEKENGKFIQKDE